MGIAPFLLGWERGVGWKLLASLNQQDLWLVVKDPNIKSLKDFKPGMKIGLPAPDSIQAVTLRKGAQQELGNPQALDQSLLAIALLGILLDFVFLFVEQRTDEKWGMKRN